SARGGRGVGNFVKTAGAAREVIQGAIAGGLQTDRVLSLGREGGRRGTRRTAPRRGGEPVDPPAAQIGEEVRADELRWKLNGRGIVEGGAGNRAAEKRTVAVRVEVERSPQPRAGGGPFGLRPPVIR